MNLIEDKSINLSAWENFGEACKVALREREEKDEKLLRKEYADNIIVKRVGETELNRLWTEHRDRLRQKRLQEKNGMEQLKERRVQELEELKQLKDKRSQVPVSPSGSQREEARQREREKRKREQQTVDMDEQNLLMSGFF
eukprot:snap_masked-scaffold_33-processed-gene-0.32-mRNA-1 protein AED:1.00 eAED:1.00 QI:0/-1/0/0/-1/1/1/0/140